MADDEEQPPLAAAEQSKWPGWPGVCVFRLIVPVAKVGSIIGRKGDLVKKMCDDTSAKIRVLDGPLGNPDRVVLVSALEEPLSPLSPAMDAVLRLFKRLSCLPDDTSAAAGFCSVRLLVASTQAINLIGKQGALIKSIQETTGASVRVLSGEEAPLYSGSDERVVELQGDGFKVLKALEAVVSHLRKFLVDHTVLPLFDKTYNPPAAPEQAVDTWATDRSSTLLHGVTQTAPAGITPNYTLPSIRESLYLNRENQWEPQIVPSGISLYGQDPTLPGLRTAGLTRAGVPIVTQITQTMQIPLSYAEDIIGIEGSNIAYIRRTSGAILTVQESRGLPDEITVEIKGTMQQAQLAQQLIQEVMNNHSKEAVASASGYGYGRIDSGPRPPSHSQLSNSAYLSTALPAQPYGGGGGGYGSSDVVGGYSTTTFRL